MGILLGLATAFCWGGADFLARFATRKIGTFRTMLYMQLAGLVLLTLVMRALGGWGPLADGSGLRPWAWGILAGTLNTSATLALYRSFEIGKMSIVAPLSASYPALTMFLSVMTGERLTLARFGGIVLTIVGVIVVARGEEMPGDANAADEQAHPGKKYLGVGWALFAAVGFGVMFWLLGTRVVPMLGSAPSVWVIRLTSFLLTGVVALAAGQRLAWPTGGGNRWILGIGVLDTGAYVLNNYGMQHEQVSVVSVLASLYGAVTVALAALVLRERVTRLQWIGIGAIFVGVFLISR
ncbi:MAG TPA: DMT family transporter [Candidatus Acidoferrum sp.]